MARFTPWVFALALTALPGCSGCTVGAVRPPMFDTGSLHDVGPMDAFVPADVGPDMGRDAPRSDVGLSPDAACESATSAATLVRLPADIIWVVDNSASMAPAIDAVQAGLNGFAAQLVASDLDYRMILLSLRTIPSGLTGRHPLCVPEPLAGPACADGSRFFQVEMDVRSTMPLEQILGTLAQSAGYTEAEGPFASPAGYGAPPWRSLLRPEATRTFVMVADDNQRTCGPGLTACPQPSDPPFTATSLEDFPGGGNPFSSRTLGPGILDASYAGLFDGYTFDAIYGYGSDTDPSVRCTYPGGTQPPASGTTYTTLVARTGGVRAQICDGAAAFGPFFDAIAASVVRGAPIACTVEIPPPPTGMTFQMGRVNVVVRGTSGDTVVGYVRDPSSCDPTRGGWYYDSFTSPTHIVLCPSSCTAAQAEVTGPSTGLDVQFGCESIVI